MNLLLAFAAPSFTREHSEDKATGGEHKKQFHKRHAKMAKHMVNKINSNGDEKVDLNELLAHSEQRL